MRIFLQDKLHIIHGEIRLSVLLYPKSTPFMFLFQCLYYNAVKENFLRWSLTEAVRSVFPQGN